MNRNTTILATSLATVIAFGASIDSADAQTIRRRISNTYSPTASDAENVRFQFTLIDVTEDGTPIVDQNLNNQNVGLFSGAIENFAEASGEICRTSAPDYDGCPTNSDPNNSSSYLYDSSGALVFLPSEPFEVKANSFDGDLLVELFNAGQDPIFPSMENITIAYTIIDRTDNKPAYTYRLEPENYSDINLNQAVNSLPYILEQNLLGRTNPVVFDGYPGGEYRYPRDLSASNPVIQIDANVPLQRRSVSTPVPEPGTILGTLAALATGALIKRTRQH